MTPTCHMTHHFNTAHNAIRVCFPILQAERLTGEVLSQQQASQQWEEERAALKQANTNLEGRVAEMVTLEQDLRSQLDRALQQQEEVSGLMCIAYFDAHYMTGVLP